MTIPTKLVSEGESQCSKKTVSGSKIPTSGELPWQNQIIHDSVMNIGVRGKTRFFLPEHKTRI